MKRFSFLFTVTVLAMLILPQPTAAYGTPPTKEEVLTTLVNEERMAQGLIQLITDDELTQAATVRAKEIAESFSHTRPDGSSCFTLLLYEDIPFSSAGENLAYGQTSPEEALDDWLASPEHKANLLDPAFEKIGVAHYFHDNTDYWVQLFISN